MFVVGGGEEAGAVFVGRVHGGEVGTRDVAVQVIVHDVTADVRQLRLYKRRIRH